jgi:hypothetical protein
MESKKYRIRVEQDFVNSSVVSQKFFPQVQVAWKVWRDLTSTSYSTEEGARYCIQSFKKGDVSIKNLRPISETKVLYIEISDE